MTLERKQRGNWTSNLGALEDVENPLNDFRVAIYGSPARFMKSLRQ